MSIHHFIVTVWTDEGEPDLTDEQAAQVMSERIGFDEDYGFHYRIGYTRGESP